ncbi:orf49 [Artaxa digramma nucleopolyhedrovirus]|uniref:Orf49 n=1 Tax=Artaxa digramma nucleopolyhedrovirus TaxID=3070910 RepID=A0AAE6R7H2_9ABAC|nr:orf49 [Euproctis digramma nucleopolyhedrovirus]QHB21708.1 orf49 [Artaxa digramma nucleopolyhedrovirus]
MNVATNTLSVATRRTLTVGDLVIVRILQHRLYKIHVVEIKNYEHYDAALIACVDHKLRYANQTVNARVIRINFNFVDVVATC